MSNPNASHTPIAHLAAIIAVGVAAFESTLPAYAQRTQADCEPTEHCPSLAVSADRQREICLNCPLPDCIGIANPQCPIRIESRKMWRRA